MYLPNNIISQSLSLKFIVLLLYFIGCNTTDPPKNNDNNKKEFTWSEEKLEHPQGIGVVPTGIWGSSPDDVWAVGWSNSHQGEIFHYDGNKWENVTPFMPFNDEYHNVYGFDSNNVYVVGIKWWIYVNNVKLSAIILHFDGTNWQIVVDDTTNNGSFESIHGNSPDNIWAAGLNGALYHYDGNLWERKPYIDSLDIYSIHCLPNGQTYFVNRYYNYPVTDGWGMLYFTEYFENNWQHRDSCLLTIDGYVTGYTFGHKAMWGVSPDKLFSVSPWYWRYNGSSWEIVYSTTHSLNDIKGSSWSNIFAVGDHGTIRYYNGNDWEWISQYSATIIDFKSVVPFDNSVFILGYYQGDSWIIKGEVIK